MKYSAILLLLLGLVFIQCDSDSDDDSNAKCTELQDALNEATNQKLATFEAHLQNPGDPTVCKNYKEALQNRIEKAQDMLDAGCVLAPLIPNTQQAIAEDQAEIDKLGC